MIRRSEISAGAARRLAVVTLAVCVPMSWAAAPVADRTDLQGTYAAGRILLQTKAGLPAAALAATLAPHGGRARELAKGGALRVIELPQGVSEAAVVASLSRHPHIKFAELDRRVPHAATSNDTYLGSQWHLNTIRATAAWDLSLGTGVTIAVLDSGVNGNHPDLAARMVPGWNFYDNNADTSDVYGHGTKVAGAAAATVDNGLGVAGVAGAARIMPLRISDTSGYAYWSTVASALTWAADHGAKVANVSYAVAGSSTVKSAAAYMKSRGGLVVVSAGNGGRDEGWAATDSLIPVSATTNADALTSWSSYGAYVAMSAPGAGIWTTTSSGGYASVSGTSFSSPITAGVVALMMAANPNLPNSEIQSRLFASAVDLGDAGRDPRFGHGRVDAAAAVQAATEGGPAPDTAAPNVSITDPLASTAVTGIVPVVVQASDNVGVARVDLRVNGSLVASDTSAPYTFAWDSAAAASGAQATLTATAVDAAGNKGYSTAVTVVVSNPGSTTDVTPPVIVGMSPNGGKVGNVTMITVTADDDSGAAGLSQRLYIDGVLVRTATGGTLQHKWNSRKASAGAHVLEAVVSDAAGNTSRRSVTVQH